MQKCIIGKKLGMTQIFDEKGTFIPVTVVEAGPCIVVQKKTNETDGYEAVQIGYHEISDKHLNKPLKGHFQKADVAGKKYLREFALSDISNINVGDLIKADVFIPGEKVDVSAVSKGKGFAGVIKRHNNRSIKSSHGSGPVHRHPGAIGANSTPSKVMKGKGLPGHMGAERVTIQNLDVVKVDAENNLIALRGAVPGPKGAIVCITDAVKGQKA
jgi:large subunit ribosomal protein L3